MLYYMIRNYQGLEEIGYLLTKGQLADMGISPEPGEGAFSANDTYDIKEMSTLKEIKKALTWEDYDFAQGCAASYNDNLYPDYVPEELRLTMCVYNPTGYTSLTMPFSKNVNPTVIKYMDILNLTEEDIKKQYSPLEKAAIEISLEVKEKNLTKENLMLIINKYQLEKGYELVYTSPRGVRLNFDTYEKDIEYGSYWVDMCPKCHNRYKNLLKGKFDNAGSGVASCSVKGCKNTNAGYYVDFKPDEVRENIIIMGGKNYGEKAS